jgi:hypothetical protein
MGFVGALLTFAAEDAAIDLLTAVVWHDPTLAVTGDEKALWHALHRRAATMLVAN